jgi:diguanylate cyclase (GGDEF)-like protein
MHDMVTGLPNRYLLQDRVQHALTYAKRYGTQSALVFLEFSAIAKIDATLGHTISAELLKSLAEQLKKCKRESDTLARVGFDKFAVLLENLPSEREMGIIIERINTLLSKPFHIARHEFFLNAQIGHCKGQQTCNAFGIPEKVELVRCYGCAMSKGTTNKTEAVNVYENILAK